MREVAEISRQSNSVVTIDHLSTIITTLTSKTWITSRYHTTVTTAFSVITTQQNTLNQCLFIVGPTS